MPPADRRALLALHNAADGPNWVNRSNWDTDVALSLWYKVTVNDQDRVVKLYLARNHLRGSIPNELVTLSELRELELAHNQLTGPIPAELGNLSALKKLSLANNQLSGPIPPELGKLAALEGLSLSNNQLTGSIPPELGKLAALQILSLSDNQLTGHIPQQLGNLSALGDLNLSWNKLNGATPPEVGNLVALQTLKLEWNRLSGSIPPELGKLAALQRLSLSNNQLTGRIPEELGKLTALRKLFLSGNQLSGAIPPKLGTLVALRNLRLSNNQLTGSIPPELGKLEALISLSLAGNQLRGTIPPELGNLAALQTLNLGWNRLSGTIQPELGDLRQLQSLVLTENHLTGSIPPELGKLAALKHLILRENQLTRLWDVLGQEKDGSRADRPGSLPVALTSLLDSFARFFGGFLSLDQNPWEHPPEAIVTDGIPAVRAYFEAIYRGGATSVTRPLKVVILGKETVGKTSLRRSIKSGRPCMTKDGGAESTVHVDAEHHDVEGQRIRIFDCAGQVVYYGLLQLFLTPRAVYLLVWDAAEASEMVDLNLESLAIAPWLRYLTFRVPDANVVLVGNKWDRVGRARRTVAGDVEHHSRQWLASWVEKARGRRPHGLSLEKGVSLTSCAPSGLGPLAPTFGVGAGTGWPCDKSRPGLLHRIVHSGAGDTRAVTMCLPLSYQLALDMLEELASSSRVAVEHQSPGMTRSSLEEKWLTKVDELKRAGTPVAAPEAAMSGAILIRKWEGGLVEYGNFIFLDVQWFATVLDPLFSHKRDLFGNIDLGGRTVNNISSLDRLDKEHVLEPQLAEELWGQELAPDLLFALKSAGLTFPLPNDPNRGLVILSRMDTKPPDDYSIKLNSQLRQADQARKHDLRLVVECSFSLGLPPGFVERLLARCCHVGFPFPFWRYGALIVGDSRTGEEGLFSMSLGYSEDSNTLTVEVFGGCREVHAWRALSKVLSVMIKMLEKFPGLPCQATFCCPLHKTKSMPIRTTDARPGSRLVEASYFCPLCQDRAAGVDFLAVALQVVEFSDEKFFDAELCRGFAENAENMALRGRALWPGANFEVPAPNHISLSDEVSAPDHTSVGHQNEALFGALEQAFTIMATACFAAFGGLVSVSTAKLWAPFLAFGLFCSLAAAASVLRKWYGQFGSWGTTGSAGGVDRSRPMNAPTNV